MAFKPCYACYPRSHGAGRDSPVGSVSAWHASGSEFDPHVRHILSWRLGHENLLTGPGSSVGRVSAPGNGRSRVRSRAATYQSR